MPLPADYDSAEGEAEAEMVIRTAIRDMMVGAAAAFGFDTDHGHTRNRYPSLETEWEAVAMVEDPRNAKNKLLRYISVDLRSFRHIVLRELVLSYAMTVALAFEDERKDQSDVVTGNSTDDLIALVFKIRKVFSDNPTLGLDDRVCHKFVQLVAKPFVPADAQGRPAQKAALTLDVVLNIC